MYVLQFECHKQGPSWRHSLLPTKESNAVHGNPATVFLWNLNSSIAESATCYEETKCPESASIATRGLTGKLKGESHGPNPKYMATFSTSHRNWGEKTPTVSWKIPSFTWKHRIKHSISVGGGLAFRSFVDHFHDGNFSSAEGCFWDHRSKWIDFKDQAQASNKTS